MQSPLKNHPFLDGNKRTALTATDIFPALNDRPLTASNEEILRFSVNSAA